MKDSPTEDLRDYLKTLEREFEVHLHRIGREEKEGSDGTTLFSIHEGDRCWAFRPIEVNRLSKERAVHWLSAEKEQLTLNNTLKDPTGLPRLPLEEDVAPLFLSSYVTEGAGRVLRKEEINYLDRAGNCYLKSGSFLAFIEGQKAPKDRRSNQPIRAFNASGLKLLFVLLAEKGAENWTYRKLAGVSGISRGTVGYVMKDLKRLGYIVEVDRERRLRNRRELIERWATEYTERLRPDLHRGRFRFLEKRSDTDWEGYLSNLSATMWGGEPAADILTRHFRPGMFTLYTKETKSTVGSQLNIAPDPEGPIELLEMFWDPEELEAGSGVLGSIVPPVLVYADLLTSDNPRAREMASKIWSECLDISD